MSLVIAYVIIAAFFAIGKTLDHYQDFRGELLPFTIGTAILCTAWPMLVHIEITSKNEGDWEFDY